MSCLHSWAAESIQILSCFSNSQTVWGIRSGAVCLHAGIAGVVALTLGGLRLCGLSLITIGQIK